MPRPVSPAVPHKVAAHAERCSNARGATAVTRQAVAAVNRPLGHGALRAHARHDAVEARLDDDAANDHLSKGGVHGLKVEDEVELADVLKKTVKRLDVDLDEVHEGERGLGGSGDDDEVERRIVAVGDERRRVRGLDTTGGARGRSQQGRQRQEVAGPGRAIGDEGEDLRDEALLDASVLVSVLEGGGKEMVKSQQANVVKRTSCV